MNTQELSENIVDDILSDLSGRCGIGNSLEEVDAETYDGLETDLIEIVKKRLDNLSQEVWWK